MQLLCALPGPYTEDGRHQEERDRAYDFLICLEETEVLQSMWQVLLDKQVRGGIPKGKT